MRFNKLSILAGAVMALSSLAAQAAEITGAGATFPAPMYAKWAEAYKAATGNQLNYQAIGSGGGQKQIIAKTVDFGATDDPLGGRLAEEKLLQFPAIIGGVVAVVNVPGITPGQLTMNGKVLGDIFRGAITTWNDAKIAAINPGVTLPATPITLVYRSDSSGTTATFTDYLGFTNDKFATEIGIGKTVNWKSGVGGKGNAGVAANVSKIGGSIGYVEYAYAKQNKLAHAAMINRDGKRVQPDDTAFAAATEKANWESKPGFGISLNDQPGAITWPITTASFILMHLTADKPARSAEALKFFDWAYKNGKQLATDLDYVPIPEAVVTKVQASWKNIKDAQGNPVWK